MAIYKIDNKEVSEEEFFRFMYPYKYLGTVKAGLGEETKRQLGEVLKNYDKEFLNDLEKEFKKQLTQEISGKQDILNYLDEKTDEILQNTANTIKKIAIDFSQDFWKQDTTSHNSLRYKDSKRDDKVFEEVRNSRVIKKSEQEPIFKNNPFLGVKYNQTKLPMSKLFEQFPNALQAAVLCSFYGANKYNETDVWDNFKRVEGGSKNYKDAGVRHMLDGDMDEESNLPHPFLKLWNALAEVELWISENNIDIKKFSENYIKDLHNKK